MLNKNRNARPDVTASPRRSGQAVAGRSNRRLHAHHGADGGARRDADSPGRRGALDRLQHLLHTERGGGRARPGEHTDFRVDKRERRGILVVHIESALHRQQLVEQQQRWQRRWQQPSLASEHAARRRRRSDLLRAEALRAHFQSAARNCRGERDRYSPVISALAVWSAHSAGHERQRLGDQGEKKNNKKRIDILNFIVPN